MRAASGPEPLNCPSDSRMNLPGRLYWQSRKRGRQVGKCNSRVIGTTIGPALLISMTRAQEGRCSNLHTPAAIFYPEHWDKSCRRRGPARGGGVQGDDERQLCVHIVLLRSTRKRGSEAYSSCPPKRYSTMPQAGHTVRRLQRPRCVRWSRRGAK